VDEKVRKWAESEIISYLLDPDVDSYNRYRIVHHIVKRPELVDRWWSYLKHGVVGEFLEAQAFELNITAILLMTELNMDMETIEASVRALCPAADTFPIENALLYAEEIVSGIQ
jgi:hypothetical protein